MDRLTFEVLVAETLESLPEQFARYLENVVVLVEDAPSPELLRSMGLNPRRDTLYGLYHGVPLSERAPNFGNVLPDQISIYYRPLVRDHLTPESIRRAVRDTLIHEIAHFFGMDEQAIRKLGY